MLLYMLLNKQYSIDQILLIYYCEVESSDFLVYFVSLGVATGNGCHARNDRRRHVSQSFVIVFIYSWGVNSDYLGVSPSEFSRHLTPPTMAGRAFSVQKLHGS